MRNTRMVRMFARLDRRRLGSALLALAALLLLVRMVAPVGAGPRAGPEHGRSRGVAPAQSDYDLSWWTVDGGGHTWSTGGGYTLGGTAGQPDAGNHAGGSYTLGGGFWEGGVMAEVLHRVYLPLTWK